jgi:hypothetical protein
MHLANSTPDQYMQHVHMPSEDARSLEEKSDEKSDAFLWYPASHSHKYHGNSANQ